MWKILDGRDWLWGNWGLILMDRTMLSKSLIQFSVNGWGYVPFLLFCLWPNYGRGDSCNGDLLQMTYTSTVVFSAPDPAAVHCQLIPPPETPGHSQASLVQSVSVVGSLLFSPGSWCAQGFVCALQESVSPVLWKVCNQIPLASKVKFPGGSQSLCGIPRLGNLLWVLELS